MSDTPLLDTIKTPQDLRNLRPDQMRQVADELRQETIAAVSVTGGHFGAGLGVVELTTAIHYVFNTPHDRLIWDVGHQAYPHKIITGRRARMRTLRQGGGLSGFTKRSESEYDPFGAAHSSTSISAGLGMAVARDLKGTDNHVIAVIGDGSMSAGMAYEAMNNAGANKNRLIVILNDNDMSIAPPVGAMSAYLARLVSSRPYTGIRNLAKRLARKLLPRALFKASNRAREAQSAFHNNIGKGQGYADPFGMFGAGRVKVEPGAPARRLGKLERNALADLDLEDEADAAKIRARYKELVKRCHPDSNGGDRSAEAKLQRVIKAYKTLQKAKLV